MKITCLSVLAMFCLASPAMSQKPAPEKPPEKSPPKPYAAYQQNSYYNGRMYEFFVWSDHLEKTPSWPEAADSPPLSPRRAIGSARADLALFLPSAANWDMENVALAPLSGQHWMYLVKFAPHQTNYNGPEQAVTVIVLMDGTAIKPVIKTTDG